MASTSQLHLSVNSAGPSGWRSASSAVTREENGQHEAHPTRRVFIGPMPEKVISHIENEVKKKKENTGVITLTQLEDEAPDKVEDVMKVVKNHAKRFVEHYRSDRRRGEDGDGESKTGSRIKRKKTCDDVEDAESHVLSYETENWDDDYDEQNLAEELIQRWRESEWGQAWKNRRKRKDKSTTSRWIGGSFEIGCLLGVNLLNPPTRPEQGPSSSVVSVQALAANPSASRSVQNLGTPLPMTPSGQSNVDSKTGLLAVPGRSAHSDSPETNFKDKGKQRQVHYAVPASPEIGSESPAPPPVPPLEVLSRTESALDPTSSQAAMLSPVMPSAGLQWGDIVMRDRMLVRVAYTKQGAINAKFDDSIHRTTRDLQYEDWAEFMVVWRRDLIELYEDDGIFVEYKNLIALYLVFQRRHLGGQIDNQELYAVFTPDNIVELCMNSLRSVPDWFALVERELTEQGKRLELCWRRDAHLDWLWLDEDIYGKTRPWAILAGLAVKQSSRPAALEIRLTSHAPTHYHLKGGAVNDEPPSIEGYVERVKPNTQLKQSLYLSTHMGLLFINHLNEAYPPSPPGLALTTQDLDSWVKSLRKSEIHRGANQVMHAAGVINLRSIVAVWSQQEQPTLDDDEDLGGEVYLLQRQDKTLVRVRRCFELLLNTGNVIRFETYSRRFALEWVNRLRLLVGYWKHKKRVDAKDEIDLAQARRPRLTPQTRVCQEEDFPPEPPADMSAPYPAMENLYNWCIIEGCSPITKATKLHMRKGLRGPYKLFYVAIVAGHLVRFRVKPGSSLHNAAKQRISLLDAYVLSGYFAAMNLPKGEFMANAAAAPRRYVDGLETDDRDEDMLFMLWYRPHPAATDAEKAPTAAALPNKSVPNLSGKHKMVVLRTRSRIERDAWCWALTTEIERISRVQTEREQKLRDAGKVIDLTK
ncbi:hypothetical protein H1R20_g1931, partial [Candolleomyces eurysporus]